MAAVVAEVVRRARVSAGRAVVVIDGRSGSGKTTLAAVVARELDAQLVGLDDVYPGWFGLEAASLSVSRCILRSDSPGHRRWDWETNQPTTWRPLDPRSAIVIEGSGSLTVASARLAAVSLWLELDAPTRRRRALARDGAAYEPWWEIWAEQEEQHIARNDPRSLADLVYDGRELLG